MKKDLIFAPIALLIGAALFMLKFTGMPVHIAFSVLGVAVLVVYAVLTKKEWRIPALEIAMRAFYGIALISGIVVINVHGVLLLSIIHKVFATLFVVSLAVLLTHKIISSKKA